MLRKSIIILKFIFAIILILVFQLLSMNRNIVQAASLEANSVYFNYTYMSGTDKTINQALTVRENNVTTTKSLICGLEKENVVSFQLFSETNVSINGITNEHKFGGNLLNLKVYSDFQTNQFEIKNKDNKVVVSSNEKTLINMLEEGKYTVTFSGMSTWIERQNLSDITRVSKLTCTFFLIVNPAPPTGIIVKSDHDNSVYFTWDNENWSATLDGTNYEKDTWIMSEGEHTIVLTNGSTTSNYIFRIDHSYKEVMRTESTCSNSGYIKYECSQCGDTFTEKIPILEHSYTITTIPANCTSGEKKLFSCQVCKYQYQEISTFPTGHIYNSIIIKSSKCNEEGKRKYTCENCQYTYESIIPTIGHDFIFISEYSSKGTTYKTYSCSVCNENYIQEISTQNDKVSNYVEYLFKQYQPYIVWVFLATAGIWSAAIGIAMIVAHKNEDKEKAKKMLVNYIMGLVIIFCILVACPLLVRGIALLV